MHGFLSSENDIHLFDDQRDTDSSKDKKYWDHNLHLLLIVLRLKSNCDRLYRRMQQLKVMQNCNKSRKCIAKVNLKHKST